MIFKYNDEIDLIRGQSSLLELGFHCLAFADVRFEFRKEYYDILTAILIRDEFKLTNLSMNPSILEDFE